MNKQQNDNLKKYDRKIIDKKYNSTTKKENFIQVTIRRETHAKLKYISINTSKTINNVIDDLIINYNLN
jgi:hypothetical protein